MSILGFIASLGAGLRPFARPAPPTPEHPPASTPPVAASGLSPQAAKDTPMTTVATLFDEAVAFVEKAAPSIDSTLVSDFKSAASAVESAFTPVADAAIVAAVDLITAKFALNAPFSATEIAFLEGVVAKLQALIPAAS